MDLSFLILLEKLDAPVDQLLFYHELDYGFCDHLIELRAILRAHFLQYSYLKPLSNRAILLLLEDINEILKNLQVHLFWLAVCQVLHSLGGAYDHGDQCAQSVLQAMVVHGQDGLGEVQTLRRDNVEDVDLDELVHEVAALVGRDLESVHTKGEENLGEAFLGLSLFVSGAKELVLMIF